MAAPGGQEGNARVARLCAGGLACGREGRRRASAFCVPDGAGPAGGRGASGPWAKRPRGAHPSPALWRRLQAPGCSRCWRRRPEPPGPSAARPARSSEVPAAAGGTDAVQEGKGCRQGRGGDWLSSPARVAPSRRPSLSPQPARCPLVWSLPLRASTSLPFHSALSARAWLLPWLIKWPLEFPYFPTLPLKMPLTVLSLGYFERLHSLGSELQSRKTSRPKLLS